MWFQIGVPIKCLVIYVLIDGRNNRILKQSGSQPARLGGRRQSSPYCDPHSLSQTTTPVVSRTYIKKSDPLFVRTQEQWSERQLKNTRVSSMLETTLTNKDMTLCSDSILPPPVEQFAVEISEMVRNTVFLHKCC